MVQYSKILAVEPRAARIDYVVEEALRLEHTLLVHSLSDLLEAGDVRARDQVVTQTVLFGGLCADLVDVLHHLVQLRVDFFRRPHKALAVLAHFKAGHADTARVDRLRRSHDHVLLRTQKVQSVVRGRHVGDFDVVLDAGSRDLLCGLHADVVLGRSRHVDVNVLHAPALLARNEFHAVLVGIGLAVHRVLRAHLEDVVELFADNAIRIMDVAVRSCKVGDLGTELSGLLHDAPADIAVAGDRQTLALDGVVLVLQDFLQIVLLGYRPVYAPVLPEE